MYASKSSIKDLYFAQYRKPLRQNSIDDNQTFFQEIPITVYFLFSLGKPKQQNNWLRSHTKQRTVLNHSPDRRGKSIGLKCLTKMSINVRW